MNTFDLKLADMFHEISPREYWYVVAEGLCVVHEEEVDTRMIELDIVRPVQLFTCVFRMVENQSEWFVKHARARRKTNGRNVHQDPVDSRRQG
jgi:hypothetical protein